MPVASTHRGKSFGLIAVFTGMLLVMTVADASATPGFPDPFPLSEAIQERLQAPDETLYCRIELPRFYALRQYMPAWLTPTGMQRDIPELLEMIEASAWEGLRPNDYHFEAILELMGGDRGAPAADLSLEAAARLELMLTDAFLLLGSHFTAGRVNPESIDPEWFANRRQGDMPKLLETALTQGSVRTTLSNQLPRYAGYRQLKAAYRRYLEEADQVSWPRIPAGPTLKKGDRDDRVPRLRERLSIWTERPIPVEEAPDIFDAALEAALIGFQARHGLEADGQLGRRTLEALNVPMENRIAQLAANMERWRWLPEDLGARHIMVNIADFGLQMVADGETILRMGVIVGKPYRHTPVFSGEMRYLVFNPSWHVPRSIAVRDKLPLIHKDPDYLRKQNMRLFVAQGRDLREIDPQAVDWPNVNAANFNFRLVQAPGPDNALGQVKFMFPNRFNVYLHDTPSRELFAKTTRNFSSGCVRLEHPIALAHRVLEAESGWDRARIDAVLTSGRETTVALSRSLPVHLLYWTAFVDGDGQVAFREDVYGRDQRLEKALRRRPT